MAIRDLILSQDPEKAIQELRFQWTEMAGIVNELLNHFNISRSGAVTSDATKIKHLESTGNPARGSSAPIQVFLNNTSGWKFAVGDEIYFNIGLPDDWVPGTSISFTVCFYSPNTTAARYVSWDMTWQAIGYGETVSSPPSSGTIGSGDILLSTTANTLTEVPFTAISGSNLTSTDHVFFKLVRTASSGTAPAAGDNPVIMHFELHYTSYVTADWV